MAEAVAKSWFRRGGLFGKYAVSFVALVVLVLAINGGLETWFTYTEVTQLLSSAQSDKAEAIARRIEQFVGEIERQINSATRASAITLISANQTTHCCSSRFRPLTGSFSSTGMARNNYG